jgi:hypothetical protein
MTGEKNLIFSEQQKFSGLVRWLLILDSVVFIIFILFLLLYVGKEHTKPLPTVVIVAIMVIPTALTILFWMAKLETQVCSDGLYVRFFPLHIDFKKFAFEDISEYYAREYRPLLEYGGWGIRYGFSGKAYNVSGKEGLQIIFKTGKKLLIGSQKPRELVAAINMVIKGTAK